MNAKQCREKAIKFLKDRNETQYKRIKEVINKFAVKGNMEASFYEKIHSEVLIRIKEEGFKVISIDERDGEITYIINW